MVKLLYNTVLSLLAVFLAMPTLAILISWNAVPGDELYLVKRGMENAILAVISPSYRARSDFQLTLVDRRINEVKASLYRLSPLALPELSEQALNAKSAIQNTTSTDLQIQNSQKLNLKLRDAKEELHIGKLYLKTSTKQPATENIVQEIDKTQQQIDQVIDDL